MYGTKARNSSTRPAFKRIALENRFENAQVHLSSVKTCGSSCGYCSRMEACSLFSLSCIDAVACLAALKFKRFCGAQLSVEFLEGNRE